MINLLPHEEMRQLRAARTNVLLFRYNILLLVALAFLILAVGVTYLQLTNLKNFAETNISENEERSSDFAPIGLKAEEFRTNLGTAKQILDREVTYTNVVLAIAKVLPRGVVLDDLSLDAKAFGTPTTLIAYAKDYASALALKESFQTSQLFSDVHFESISAGDGATNGSYPVTVNLSVTIVKDVAK